MDCLQVVKSNGWREHRKGRHERSFGYRQSVCMYVCMTVVTSVCKYEFHCWKRLDLGRTQMVNLA